MPQTSPQIPVWNLKNHRLEKEKIIFQTSSTLGSKSEFVSVVYATPNLRNMHESSFHQSRFRLHQNHTSITQSGRTWVVGRQSLKSNRRLRSRGEVGKSNFFVQTTLLETYCILVKYFDSPTTSKLLKLEDFHTFPVIILPKTNISSLKMVVANRTNRNLLFRGPILRGELLVPDVCCQPHSAPTSFGTTLNASARRPICLSIGTPGFQKTRATWGERSELGSNIQGKLL